MPSLPARPDFQQLRHQARDLLRAARNGDATALTRIHAVADEVSLANAQLALAREYGFTSWTRLKVEVDRREALDDVNVDGLVGLLAREPQLAVAEMTQWCDHPLGASPLNYVAMMRYDTSRDIWRDVPGAAALAGALLAAGAPVDGEPGGPETPLITAASYGDAEVAKVLIQAGADLEATSSPTSGGVPSGNALLHAAVFGMTAVVDVLVKAGARVGDLVMGAAAGDISRWPLGEASPQQRLLALIMATDHQRLTAIETLVAAGTPVDGVDEIWSRHPLRLAATNGRPASVRCLLALGADPNLRDADGHTPLDLCRADRPRHLPGTGHAEVEQILEPLANPTGG
jgi:ankyrin repeat protein